jgi:ankyrin repeat protein
VVLLYIFGISILSARFLFQVAGIFRTVRRAEDLVKDTDCTIVNVKDDFGPRSFFNYIFMNPEKYNPETYEQILEHEKIHVKEWHSLDLMISEIAIIILWFNPFIWVFRKEVEKNIEYQTDALMLDSHVVEPKKYQMNLLKIGVARKPLTIVTNYNQSLIKKRIIMMNTRNSNGHSYWKYAFIVPTLFITLLTLNPPFALTAQEKDNSTPANESGIFNIDFGSDNDRAPLLQAAWTGDFEGVKKLVEEGADVNFLQRGEGTALVLAIRHEEFKIARFLLEKGADPNLGTTGDGHPLWIAARKGNIELVRLLVNHGADVNTKFPGDGSALIQASQMGNMVMVKALVDLKADVNMAVKGDGNPLIQAAKGGYPQIVEYLVGLGADINREVPGDETPLINASEQGHLDIVTFLVEKGADVNKVCSELHNGKTRVRTALKVAEEYGHEDVIRYLKSKGARN